MGWCGIGIGIGKGISISAGISIGKGLAWKSIGTGIGFICNSHYQTR